MQLFLKFKTGYFIYHNDVSIVKLLPEKMFGLDYIFLTVIDNYGNKTTVNFADLIESCQQHILNLNEGDIK